MNCKQVYMSGHVQDVPAWEHKTKQDETKQSNQTNALLKDIQDQSERGWAWVCLVGP